MKKPEYESCRHDAPSVGSENSTVHMQAGRYQLTDVDTEQLAKLAALPEQQISFHDIPRLTRQEYETAMRSIAMGPGKHLQKAS